MKRVGMTFDLDMPAYRRRSGVIKALFLRSARSEHPVPGSYAMKVLLLHPSGSLVGMPPLRPSPDHAEDLRIDPLVGLLCTDVVE